MKSPVLVTLLSFGFATPALSDFFFADNAVIDGHLCVGPANCEEDEIFGSEDMKIKSSTPELLFEDTTSGSQNNWALKGDDNSAGATDSFSISNETPGTTPFAIAPTSPDSTLFLSGNGDIGMGTTAPVNDLHIVSSFTPEIRLEQSGGTFQSWDLAANELNFFLQDVSATTVPLLIETAAPNFAFVVASSGNVGLGTSSPDAPLEVSSNGNFNFFRISATGATNDSVDITYTGGPLGTGQLRYNIVDGDNQEMSLDANGNMVLDGTLTTAGPTCSGGCDRVFEDGYALPSIRDHADQMYSLGHLPSLNPTLPGQPVNLSERQGQMLNALEHAHIYIAQQHGVITQLSADKTALEARLDVVEAQMSAILAAQ